MRAPLHELDYREMSNVLSQMTIINGKADELFIGGNLHSKDLELFFSIMDFYLPQSTTLYPEHLHFKYLKWKMKAQDSLNQWHTFSY